GQRRRGATVRRWLAAAALAVDDASRDRRIDIHSADHDRADGVNEIFHGRSLQDIAADSGFQRLIEIGAVFVEGEHQHAQLRNFADKAPAQHDSVDLRHRNIEHGDVGAGLANELQRGQTAARFADQLEIIFRADEIAQPVQDNRMVVGQYDSGFAHAADLCPSRVMRAKIVVPAPGAVSTSSVPPTSASRSRMPSRTRPRGLPAWAACAPTSKPRPLSSTSTCSVASVRRMTTLTSDGRRACLTILVSPSWTTRYTAVAISSGTSSRFAP